MVFDSASKFFPHMSPEKLQDLSESCNFDFHNGMCGVGDTTCDSLRLSASLSLLVFVIPC